MITWFRKKMTLVEETPAEAPKSKRPYSWSTHEDEDDFGVSTTDQLNARLTTINEAHEAVRKASITAGVMDEADGNGRTPDFKVMRANNDQSVSDALALWYSKQSFIGHQLAGIVAQHWLIDKACKMPARDAIRNGYEIVSADGDPLDPERVKLIRRWDRRFNLRKSLEEFVHMGRVFGIRICLFKVNSTDPEYYVKPFNPDGVTAGSYKGMVQVDPYWCTPLLDGNASSEPDTKHFYEPTFWQINGQKYHRTHLIIFRNGELADILKPLYLYGGVPVPQRIMERVYAAERTANEAPQLAMTKRSTVFYTDVAKALANFKKFTAQLTRWRQLLDNFGVKVADKTDDKVEQFDVSLGDLDTVIMTQYQVVAAAAGVPSTKLLGTSPKGFGGEGDYEQASYAEELETIQTNDLTPLAERHWLLVDRSIVVPKLKVAPVEVTADWNPVDSPSASEWADINLKKSQTAQTYQSVGALDQYDIRESLRNDKTSGYSNIPEAERPNYVDQTDDDNGSARGSNPSQVSTGNRPDVQTAPSNPLANAGGNPVEA